ncbi:MAG: DUF748 domain-containing protein [Planctomycetes bacterium]|nr:DUF748 domain-containing protein [Planctomycetota bacterium]
MPSRRRRWRRRLLWCAVALVAARLVLALLLPWLVGLAASAGGLTIECRSVRLSLSGGWLRLDDVVLRDAAAPADSTPLLTAHEVHADVATWQLLRGQFAIVDVILGGARVHLQHAADGALLLPRAWVAPADAAPAPAVAPTAAAPWRFDLPFTAASIRVHDLQVTLAEATTGVGRRFTIDVDATDLGHRERPATIDLRGHAPDLFDECWLSATVTARGRELQAQWRARVRGLRPSEVPWLDGPMGPPAPHVFGLDLDGALTALAHATAADEPPAITARTALRVQLDERQRLALDVQAGPSEGTTSWGLPFSVALHGEDLVGALQLTGGRATVDADGFALHTTLQAEQLTLRLLAPWLTSLGVHVPAAGLAATAALAAQNRAGTWSATVSALQLGSAEQRLELPRLQVDGVRPDADGLALGTVAIDGPTLGVVRDRDGGVTVAGVRFTAPTAAARAAPPTAPVSSVPFVWPRLRLDSLAWQGLQVEFQDLALPAPAAVSLQAEVIGAQLALGAAAGPGTLAVRLGIPDAVETLRADLTTTPSPTGLTVAAELTAERATARAFAPWLARAGLTPSLQDGRLRARAELSLDAAGGATTLAARLADVRFRDGDELLFGLRRCEGNGLATGPGATLGAWTLDEPFLAVQRAADGTTSAFGITFGPAPAPAPPPTTPTPAAPPAASPPATGLRHGELALRRAVVRFTDHTTAAPTSVALGADLSLGAAEGGEPAPFRGELRFDPGVGAVGLQGSLALGPARGQLDLDLDAAGLRGRGLQPMLPLHLTCTLDEADFTGSLRVRWGDPAPSAVTATLRGLSLRDRGAELVALDLADLQLAECTGERLHVVRAVVHGLRAVAGAHDGALLLPGLRVAPTPAPTPAPSQSPDAAPTPVVLPALAIDELSLGIDRLTWRERGPTDGAPVELQARLELAAPWATAADLTATPPCRLVATASAKPLVGELTASVELQPFALAPTAVFTLRAAAIDTTQLPAIAPRLAGRVAGTCTAGTFTATGQARLALRRRDPRLFDFANAFGAELQLDDLDLREAPDGASLVHVDEIAVDARAIDPRTGDVLLRLVEVEGPRLLLRHGPDGLDLGGVRLLPAAPPAATATAPAPAALPPASDGPAPEFAVDRLQVAGLEVTFLDGSTTPPTVLPLQDCELRLQNATTRARTEPRTIAWSALLRGGDVPLERRVLRSSVFAGVLGSAAGMLAGDRDEHEPEHRPLVDAITIRGELQPFPAPVGQISAEIDAFELPALRGLAKAGGVDIADGVLDLELEAKLRGNQGIDLRVRPKFTWLSLSEPPGGPLSTYLKLPAPLDTVLFVLRNENDEHVLPLRVEVPGQGLSTGAVTDAAVNALVRLIADAVAGAAFRVSGVVTGAVGLGGGEDLRSLVGALEFPPGEPLPSGGSLDAVLAAATDDPGLAIVLQHELGRGDVARAAELAAPPRAVVEDCVARLRAERSQRQRQRDEVAVHLAALYAAGRMQDAWQLQETLAGLDRQLGELVQTLEDALQLLAGENDRALRRRARAAAAGLAEHRLAAVRAQIVARLGPGAADRVEWRPPRTVETAGLDGGGRVIAGVRRRALR